MGVARGTAMKPIFASGELVKVERLGEGPPLGRIRALSLSDSEPTRYYVVNEGGSGDWYYAEELEALEIAVPRPAFEH